MNRTWLLLWALGGCGARASANPCPPDMALIPAGKFTMGSQEHPDEIPLHEVTLARPFCIDRREVTVEAYDRCVRAGRCTAPHPGFHCNAPNSVLEVDQHPQNCIDWYEARTYCEWAKKRLPTEPEWEFAARGPEGRRFPWGNEEPDATHIHWGGGGGKRAKGTAPVGSHPRDVSAQGVLDMGGNVSEWVQFGSEQLTWDESAAAAGEWRPIKGDGWTNGREAKPSWTRWILFASGALGQSNEYGVRCAADASEVSP